MGALDRIVSASGAARDDGGRGEGRGHDAPGVEGAKVAVAVEAQDERAGRNDRLEGAIDQDRAHAHGELTPPAGAPHDDARPRGERAARDDRDDRLGRGATPIEAEARRAREGAETDAQRATPGRERPRPAPVAAETTARREGAAREGLRRVLDPTPQRREPRARPEEAPPGDTRARPIVMAEARREQIVRERVIERTIVERLLTPAPAPAAPDARRPAIPSLVRQPEPREADRTVPRRDAAEAPRDPRDAHDRPRAVTAAPDRAPSPEAPRVPEAPRLAPRAPEKRAEAQAKRGEAPPPPRDVARPDARREVPREDRARKVEAATRPAAPPAARPVAALVAPRPQRPATPANKPPAREPSPRDVPGERQHREARPLAQRPATPRIQISIGRVEVRGKTAAPPLQRVSVGGPRAHQIDPGLPFGPIEGGRI